MDMTFEKEAANDDKIHFDTIEKAIGYYVNNSEKKLNYREIINEFYKKDGEIERLRDVMLDEWLI